MNNRSPKGPTATLLLIILSTLLLGVNARKGIHPSPLPEAGSCQADSDGDAVCESADNCPLAANAGQQDQDTDGVGDVCDACPTSSGASEDTCLGPGTWQTRPGNSVARGEAGLVEVGGSLYLIAGENTASVEIYNVATRTWTTGLPMPSARNHIQAVTVNGKIYVLGGLTQFPGPSLNQNLMFDPQNPALGWQTRAPLPTSRGALGCAADGIKIYCAGGLSSTAGNTAINVMEVYDTLANTWATLAPMPRDRDHFQAEIIKGKFYAVSGRDTTIGAKLAFNDIYDIATNTWSQGAPIPTPRGGYASEAIQGRLLIIGGEGSGPSNGTFPNVEEYDPRRNTWRALANIPTPRHGVSAAIATVETGNPKDARLYAISGGPSEGGSNSTVNEVFFFRLACSVNADCDDGNTCTTDICVTGTCQRTNNNTACNDGVACTSADVCSGGSCAGTNNCTGGQVCNLGTGQCGPPGSAVTSFTLINADSDLPIASFDPLTGGAVLNLATLPTQNLNVRANTSPATASVVFGLDGNPTFRIESGAPYALAGDVGGNYNPWTPSLGSHSLTGTAWTSTGGTGTPGPPLTINFTVLNQPAGECVVNADCDDGNACTQDTCSAQTCQHSNNTASCNDGKACTSGDVCSGGVCAGVVNCAAGQICSPSTGLCVPGGPAVVSFSLINADTDQPIAALNPLTSGASLNLATLPTRNLNIRANTSPATVGSVQFGLDGNPNFRTESGAPYALAGDVSGNYSTWTPSVGSHALTATPFSGSGATGTAGTPLSISFSVSDNGSVNQAPLVNAGLNQTITLPTSTVTLSGSALDDGLPAPPSLSYTWSRFSGAGTVTFTTPNAPGTQATFPSAGTYVLRLSVFDGLLIGFDDVTVTVNPVPSGQVLVSFTLINADTDQPIAAFNPLTSGTTLNLATLPSRNINIRANTSPATVGSVVFGLDGNPAFRTESGVPYALAGDLIGNYTPWTWTLGPHTLTGTPYSGSGSTGTAGTPLTITFTLIDVP